MRPILTPLVVVFILVGCDSRPRDPGVPVETNTPELNAPPVTIDQLNDTPPPVLAIDPPRLLPPTPYRPDRVIRTTRRAFRSTATSIVPAEGGTAPCTCRARSRSSGAIRTTWTATVMALDVRIDRMRKRRRTCGPPLSLYQSSTVIGLRNSSCDSRRVRTGGRRARRRPRTPRRGGRRGSRATRRRGGSRSSRRSGRRRRAGGACPRA